MQRIGADISARLAQIAKDPPDLNAYFRLHAECVVQILQPVGLTYEMANGSSFQRAISHNYDSLKLRDAPAQENSFQRAVRTVAQQGKPLFLDVQNGTIESLRGLAVEDAPAPESLPPHNSTPFQHAFAPITLNKKVIGVLHAWFSPVDATTAHARAALVGHAASETELYFKARRVNDISQELTRIGTYANFLEDVAGDQDLQSVSWKLVNYAREAIGCDRVCLLVDSRYGLTGKAGTPVTERFELQACSGLRRPHPHSEHAELLIGMAAELLKLTIVASAPAEPAAKLEAKPDTPAPAAEAANGNAEKKSPEPAAATPRPATQKPGDERPKMRIVFTQRDPSMTPTRPEAVNHYFDTVPMNWATVLPLFDRNNVICGTLLFEGQQLDEKTRPLFNQMRDLAVSGGRALSTSLVWQRRRTLRIARFFMDWRDELLATPRRRLVMKYGVPSALIIGLLAFPYPYNISGDATMRPEKVQSIVALTTARLVEVNAREGDYVKKGQVLCVLDSSDLELQLRQITQERERALTEASLALHQERSEMRMQIAQLTAEKAATMAAKVRKDIEQTVIRAPFDGVLVGPQDFTQRRGQILRVGETVAEVADPKKWEVKVAVREQDVPALIDRIRLLRAKDPAAGVPADVKLTANPDHIYHVQLTDPESFSNRLDTSGGKYSFSAIIPVPETVAREAEAAGLELKAGYSGRAKFSCGRRPLIGVLFGDFVRFLRVNFF